jgi:hypothetical protein
MNDLFALKKRKQGLAERRKRILYARRRDLGAGASLVLQHGDPENKSPSSVPQVTIYRLTAHEAEVVTLALLDDLDEQITATSKEIERAALSAEPRKLPGAGEPWTGVSSAKREVDAAAEGDPLVIQDANSESYSLVEHRRK